MKESFKLFFQKHPKLKYGIAGISNELHAIWAQLLSDKAYVKWMYRKYYHKSLNLEHPITFQEKLQWIKLYDRKPIYHQMVDKIEAKEYVSNNFGIEYCIPTISEYNSFEEVEFDKLPNEFILKSTFDSHSYYLCRDKSKIDVKEAKRRLYSHWKHDYSIWSREWPYKGLKHRIIAEPLIGKQDDIFEYKFFCFNGEPKLYQTCYDRSFETSALLNFYDIKGNLLELNDKGHNRVSDVKLPYPQNMEKMLEIAREASKETYFLRVDFYEIKGKLYCGEFTFFENGGYCEFTPEKYNQLLGDWIKLPSDK